MTCPEDDDPPEYDWQAVTDRFPMLDPGVTRTVYVDNMPATRIEVLKARGYKVRHLGTMPRENDDENRAYLVAKAQAVEEGTAVMDDKQLQALKVQMHTSGLMAAKKPERKNQEDRVGDALKILEWFDSRHTLAGNSTVQSATKLKGREG